MRGGDRRSKYWEAAQKRAAAIARRKKMHEENRQHVPEQNKTIIVRVPPGINYRWSEPAETGTIDFFVRNRSKAHAIVVTRIEGCGFVITREPGLPLLQGTPHDGGTMEFKPDGRWEAR